MEFSNVKELKTMSNDLLLNERRIALFKKGEAIEYVNLLNAEMKSREMEFDEVVDERSLLKKAIDLLVRLDIVVEDKLPEWRSSSDLIAEIDDFYKEAEVDGGLAGVIEKSTYDAPLQS